MLIAGVAPPDDTTGAVPVTLVTVPDPLLLKVVQSAALNTPRLVADAVGRLSVITGVVVELATVDETSVPVVPKVNADTLVTVPVPAGLAKMPGVDHTRLAVDLELTKAMETHTLATGVTGGVLDQPVGGVPVLVTKLQEPPVGADGVLPESRKIRYSK
jgi:hypothetical protein